MIKKFLHTILLIVICFTGFTQTQELFFQIVYNANNNDSLQLQHLLANNNQYLKQNAKFAKACADEISLSPLKSYAYNIASYHPNTHWGAYALAKQAAENNHTAEAINYLSIHLNQKKYRLTRATIFNQNEFNSIKNTNEWKILWDKVNYKDKDLKYESALKHLSNNNIDWALETVDNLILNYPNNHKYLALRAKIFSQQEQYHTALTDINHAIEFYSRNADYHMLQADILIHLKRYSKAINSLTNAERINPFNSQLILHQIMVYGLKKDAANLINKAESYSAYTNNYEILYYLADAYISTKEYKKAISQLNKVISEAKPKAKYFEARGNAYFSISNWDKAMFDYSMALDINPKLANAYFNYGICRYEQGNTKGACYMWRKALALNHPYAEELLFKYCDAKLEK